MLMLYQVNYCCCGFSLKKGTIIFGVLKAVFCTIFLAGFAYYAAIFTNLSEKLEGVHNEKVEFMFGYLKALLIILSIRAIFTAVQLVLSILLVYGAAKEDPKFVKIWLAFCIVWLGISTMLHIVSIIMALMYGRYFPALKLLAFAVLGTGIRIYSLVVVNSFHLELIGRAGMKPFA